MSDSVSTFSVVIEHEGSWYVAHVPGMPGCHTQGKTKRQVLERIKEAIALYLESGGKPEPGHRVIGVERVEVPA